MELSKISKLSPAEFEELVASILQKLGHEVTPIKLGEDIGIDILARKGSDLLAVQVKKYVNRKVNLAMVYHTYGAAAFYDCSTAIIFTLSELTENAKLAAKKLKVEIWGQEKLLPLVSEEDIVRITSLIKKKEISSNDWFYEIWNNHVKKLEGEKIKHISRDTYISILSVDNDGITIINSNNKKRNFDIDIFRQVITKLKAKGVITREEINDDYQRRGSSAITAILATLPGVKKDNSKKKTTLKWET